MFSHWCRDLAAIGQWESVLLLVDGIGSTTDTKEHINVENVENFDIFENFENFENFKNFEKFENFENF